jgi:hypothetical protein
LRTLTAAAVLILCLCLSTGNVAGGQTPDAPSTPAPADKAPSKGTQIGQIVSDAVNTAFPIIGKIMDLFKSKKSVNKDEVTAAVEKAQSDFVKAAKEEVKPVAAVSKELGVIQAFATAGVSASQNLAAIERLLASEKTDYGRVSTEWGIAKNYLADVLVIKPEDIQAVRDTTIQARIITLQKARKDLMKRIDDNIAGAQKNPSSLSKPELQSQITAMSGLLDGFDTLAAVELSALQADIDNLAKWANKPAGVINFTAKKPNPRLLKIIDDAASQAQSASVKKQ